MGRPEEVLSANAWGTPFGKFAQPSAMQTKENKKKKGNKMGDKSPKAIKKKAAHGQSKTKNAKKKEKHLALSQQSTTPTKRK